MDIVTPHVRPPAYDDTKRRVRLDYLRLDERDVALLHELKELIGPRLSEIADQFYEHLLSIAETRDVFRDQAMVERLKEAQKAYLHQSLSGPYDREYFKRRWRIGYVHNAIKLEPQWFIGAFQLYHRILFPMVMERYGEQPQAALERMLALDKVMNLDEQLGIESYMAHYVATMDQLRSVNVQIQEVSEAKSRFLADMSHELRTPLNAILGFSEVLQDQATGVLDRDQRQYLEEIHKAGELLLRLIGDVLDLAKVEAGRLELFFEPVAVGQLVREAVATLRGAADKKGLWIEALLPAELGTIAADRIRLKQVLYNLLSNAVKFTDHGGITVSAAREDGWLHVTVQDTGIGIAPEDQERIFEAFAQVSTREARRHEGTGLGLAVSARLVQAHGGRLEVDSALGQGSVFHVWLPEQRPEELSTPGSEANQDVVGIREAK